MFEREISDAIKDGACHYPVILLQGPRQSGKTTLVRHLFADKKYCSLENPDIREWAAGDARGFLSGMPDGAVLDEIQNVPSLLSYLQQIVDDRNQKGLFVITGSSNFKIMKGITQSLAGRCAVYKLLPLSVSEMKGTGGSLDDIILRGGYPAVIKDNLDSSFYYQNYIETYIQKDVRSTLNIKEVALFDKFIQVLATRIGSLLDITSVANDVGISTKTVREWLSVLEQSYICFTLHPFYENRTKRLVKTPKLYFYDTGLACRLLKITSAEQLSRDKMRGVLFENLVISEQFKHKFNFNLQNDFYFYRTSSGIEVDLVEENGGFLIPSEIKSASTFSPQFVKNIKVFESEYGERVKDARVIYNGQDMVFQGVKVCTF